MASIPTGRTHAITEYARRLRTALGDRLVDLRLFGSVARGDDRLDSDIDILIIIRGSADERGRTEREAVDLAFDVNLEHDVYNLASGADGRDGHLPRVGPDTVSQGSATRECGAVVSPGLEVAGHRLQRARETLEEADVLIPARDWPFAERKDYR